MNVAKWYYAERWCYMHHLKPLAMMIKGAIRIIWGCYTFPDGNWT